MLLALVAFGLAVDRFYAFYELQSCTGWEGWEDGWMWQKWGIFQLDGLFHGKSQPNKWMLTGGRPMTQVVPPRDFF